MRDTPFVVEQIKTKDLRKLVKFVKIFEIYGTDGKVTIGPCKRQILTVVLQNCE